MENYDESIAADALDVTETSTSTPIKKLRIYRRLAFGRKHLFSPSDSDPAEYFVLNPVPHKHASTWTPVFYRGDNPKYDTNSKKIARAWRTALWSSFNIELGDGVHEVLENRRRVRERKCYERKQKFRRVFWMESTPPKKPLEEVQPVEGFVMVMKMHRAGFLKTSLKWTLGKQEFRKTGTREFLPKWACRWKAISHDMKIATAMSWQGNSGKEPLGIVQRIRQNHWTTEQKKNPSPSRNTQHPYGHSDTHPLIRNLLTRCSRRKHVSSGVEKSRREQKRRKNLNLDGSHSGDSLEEAVVFTCWIALEAEHRLRYKVLDLLEEIGERIGG